jgi:hypothetical protein
MTTHATGPHHKITEHEKHMLEIGVLIVGAILLFLWLESQGSASATPTATPADAVTPSGTTGPSRPVNLSFQTPPINVSLEGGYGAGYVPLFGFLGYGPFW